MVLNEEVYDSDQEDDITLLVDITSRPGAYGDPPDQGCRQPGVNTLGYHSPSPPYGTDFLIPPPQNIDRELHRGWASALARFRRTNLTYDGVEYWALPDLLGFFMSSLGRAPTMASKRNFYLPLTAVYGRRCTKLSQQGRHTWQRVFQCSWTEDGEFHLRASRGQQLLDARERDGILVAVLTVKTSIPTLSLADIEYTDSFEKDFYSRDHTVMHEEGHHITDQAATVSNVTQTSITITKSTEKLNIRLVHEEE
ncbi:hypothetical protein CDV55_103996 [Aspergillus turcosus]|nr:hypothetical protein CDV55_103996 [Aspergillus turcosus]